jgi:hypothetical protein
MVCIDSYCASSGQTGDDTFTDSDKLFGIAKLQKGELVLAKRRSRKGKSGDFIGLAVIIIILIGLTGGAAKLNEVLGTVAVVVVPIAIIVTVAVAALLIVRWRRYKKSDYYEQKQNLTAWINPPADKGAEGEFTLGSTLERLPGYKRLLFNVYVTKPDGTTTEVDVIMLHTSGIYVIESKNYRGWIFGSEGDRQWTQSFPNGRKERFYNPVMQNEGHIKALMELLSKPRNSFHSVVVFGNDATLKKINLTSSNSVVLRRGRLAGWFSGLGLSNASDDGLVRMIDDMYQRLLPLTQTDETTRQRHIEQVRGNPFRDS